MYTRRQEKRLQKDKNESGIQRQAEMRDSTTPEKKNETERVVAWTPEKFPSLNLILCPFTVGSEITHQP